MATMTETPCPVCNGSGHLPSKATAAAWLAIMQAVKRLNRAPAERSQGRKW